MSITKLGDGNFEFEGCVYSSNAFSVGIHPHDSSFFDSVSDLSLSLGFDVQIQRYGKSALYLDATAPLYHTLNPPQMVANGEFERVVVTGIDEIQEALQSLAA